MAKTFGDGQFPLKCGQCGHEFTETIARLEAGSEFTCPACGVITHYDAEQLRSTMDDVDRKVDDLRKAFNKTIKFDIKL